MGNSTDQKVYINIAKKAMELNEDHLKDDETRRKELIKYVKSLFEDEGEK